uniref:Uncharacterized protein n=1 Tax=Trypanosoma vivax (strain Y486) TaxID=1055687 RepID=G0U7F1_TRYVY|nr:hypothetical protein TVY486_1008550 [Trypanosoma vivax Y486]
MTNIPTHVLFIILATVRRFAPVGLRSRHCYGLGARFLTVFHVLPPVYILLNPHTHSSFLVIMVWHSSTLVVSSRALAISARHTRSNVFFFLNYSLTPALCPHS